MNVKNQEFFILNKKVSKDLFERTVVDKKLLEQLALEFEKLRQNHPRKENTNLHSEKVTGNYIQHGNNIHTSFDITDSENCKYSTWLFHAKNCYDVYDWGNTAENCYECHKV